MIPPCVSLKQAAEKFRFWVAQRFTAAINALSDYGLQPQSAALEFSASSRAMPLTRIVMRLENEKRKAI